MEAGDRADQHVQAGIQVTQRRVFIVSNTRAMKSSGPTEGDAYASGLFATRPVGSTNQRSLANGMPATRAAIHSAV